MDIIESARQLGREIQKDERYLQVTAAAKAVNEDPTLAKMVADFKALREELETLSSDGAGEDAAKTGELNAKMRTIYEQIHAHPAMVWYTQACEELEDLVGYAVKIITGSANGENPDTIEKEEACTGSCETCGGCH